MIVIDGYTIEQYPKQNMIVIGLPQTLSTATSTQGHISNRRDGLSDIELSTILQLAKSYFELKEQSNGRI